MIYRASKVYTVLERLLCALWGWYLLKFLSFTYRCNNYIPMLYIYMKYTSIGFKLLVHTRTAIRTQSIWSLGMDRFFSQSRLFSPSATECWWTDLNPLFLCEISGIKCFHRRIRFRIKALISQRISRLHII
jgi:hypothetical protein